MLWLSGLTVLSAGYAQAPGIFLLELPSPKKAGSGSRAPFPSQLTCVDSYLEHICIVMP